MPDITMCKDTKCPQKDYCFRYTAQPSEYRQAYFTESPNKMDGCPYFVHDDRKHRLPQRTWKHLTGEEILKCIPSAMFNGDLHATTFALEIEALLKEKNT